MTGRAEVDRLRKRLGSAFARFGRVGNDLEVQADFARYLCILVAGYLERAIAELAAEHCRVRSAKTVLSYVLSQLDRFRNPNTERILSLLATFDLGFRQQAADLIVDDLKVAVDSVMALRNQIAHGEDVGVTFGQIDQYRQGVEKVVAFIADLFLPPVPALPAHAAGP